MKTVIITGASSGIGEATAYKFATEGYNLILIARSLDKLKKVQEKCIAISSKKNDNLKIEVLSEDINHFDKLHVREKFLQVIANFTQVSILINNAGIYERNSTGDSNIQIWENMFQTNLFGSVKITDIILPIFQKNKSGSIINVASTLGIKPAAGTSAYSASKAAMINWTTTLAQEGGAFNIRANAICPGIIETPIHPFYEADQDAKEKIHAGIKDMQLLNKIGDPKYVAESIYFLATDLSQWTTGIALNVDGGINIK